MSDLTKKILEVYRPRSDGERNFLDKHIVVKHKDRNGNGDDVFKAKNVKVVKRYPEHGYDPGQDEQFYEDVEDLDESNTPKPVYVVHKKTGNVGRLDSISGDKSTADVTWNKTSKQTTHPIDELERLKENLDEAYTIRSAGHNKVHVVKNGKVIKTCSNPQDAKFHISKLQKEEVEELDEAKSLGKGINHAGKAVFDKSNGRTGSVWNSYTDGSHDIKWKGDSKPTRHDWMYAKNNIRISTSKDEHKKYIKEEQIDEISKKTLGSYIKKASEDRAAKGRRHVTRFDFDSTDPSKIDSLRKIVRRRQGIDKAVDKLTKEDVINNAIDKFIKEDERTLEEKVQSLIEHLPETFQDSIFALYETLNEDNQKLLYRALKEEGGVDEILDYVISEVQLDELSKKTLGSYIKRAHMQHSDDSYWAGRDDADDGARPYSNERLMLKNKNRDKGISRAIKRLAKEEAEDNE